MKTKTFTLFGFFFLCVLFYSWGQQNKKLDSLIGLLRNHEKTIKKANLLNDIIQIELYSHPVKVITRIDELIELSKKIDYIKGEAEGYYRKGGYFLNKGELDSAEHYHNKSLQIHTEIKDTKGILNNNNQIARIHMYQNKFYLTYKHLNDNIKMYENRDSLNQNSEFQFIGSTYHTLSDAYSKQANYNLSLKYELKAYELYKKYVDDELYIADALNSLGDTENSLNNYEQAIIYLKEANEIYVKNGDRFSELLTLHNLGYSYYGMKNYDESLRIIRQGIDLAKKTNNRKQEADLWINYGKNLDKLNQTRDAIQCQKKAIAISKKLGNKISILHSYLNLGNLYKKNDDFENAEYYLNLVISETKKNDLTRLLAIAYEYRSNLYESMDNPVSALSDYKKFKRYKDSLFDISKAKQIEAMRAEFDTEKKEQQIALQNKEITVLEQEAKINNQQRWLLGGGMTLSTLALGFGFYGFRERTKKNKLEKEKVDAELAFKKKELTTHALHLAKKNEVLENVKLKAKDLKSQGDAKGYQELIKTINFDQQDDKNWESFTQYFEQVHKDFAKNVKNRYPEVTKNELRFMALLKMSMSSKEIATILNISPDGIKKARQRLRKKMALTPEDSLETMVMAI